jgi:hypothetical protein
MSVTGNTEYTRLVVYFRLPGLYIPKNCENGRDCMKSASKCHNTNIQQSKKYNRKESKSLEDGN